jgi:2-(1,2-epoxy-1,2-dihydrophenyl)acetyl-CoA isomerase
MNDRPLPTRGGTVSDTLLLDHTGGVATLTLNRPESMNSLSLELKEALVAALAEVRDDAAVRAVVLAGAGRAFCVGQDLREHAALLDAGDPAPLETVRDHYNPIARGIATMPKPVVAAVRGMAAGAGAGFAFAS